MPWDSLAAPQSDGKASTIAQNPDFSVADIVYCILGLRHGGRCTLIVFAQDPISLLEWQGEANAWIGLTECEERSKRVLHIGPLPSGSIAHLY